MQGDPGYVGKVVCVNVAFSVFFSGSLSHFIIGYQFVMSLAWSLIVAFWELLYFGDLLRGSCCACLPANMQGNPFYSSGQAQDCPYIYAW